MDSDLAKGILQAILSRAEGQVGSFVDLRELALSSPFESADVDVTLDELLVRRWIYRKGDLVCVSKPGLEYAIDWSLADRVLEAIATVASSRGGVVVSYSQVIAAAGLPPERTDEVMSELGVLGLAATTTSDGKSIDGAYISAKGLSRLAGRAPGAPRQA
ncbi:MAG TPA: hypothetical protein VK968_11225 [Roseimicrobium sp.]|nr:hypothetical protein [Roseimicrobium sp.]